MRPSSFFTMLSICDIAVICIFSNILVRVPGTGAYSKVTVRQFRLADDVIVDRSKRIFIVNCQFQHDSEILIRNEFDLVKVKFFGEGCGLPYELSRHKL